MNSDTERNALEDIRFLFVHKGGAHDPGLQAMLRWLPRIIKNYRELVIADAARGKKSLDTMSPLPCVLDAICTYEPTHILTWVPLFNEAELQACHERNIVVSAIANSFVSLSSGIFKDQSRFLELLARYNAYFIPHAPHLSILRRHGVSAIEMPFFYDPEVYFPKSKSWWRCWEREYPVLFIGSVMEPGAENRLDLLAELSSRVPVYIVTYQRPAIPRAHWLGVANSERRINRLLNRGAVILGSDFVTDRQLAEFNKRIENMVEPYTDRYTLRVRVATSMGAGCCYAVEHHEEMLRYAGGGGAGWLSWNSNSEALALISRMLQNRNELAQIAMKGWNRIKERHTVNIRIHEMLSCILGAESGNEKFSDLNSPEQG